MKMVSAALCGALIMSPAASFGQVAQAQASGRIAPAGLMFQAVAMEEITSKTTKVGTPVSFQVATDVIENGVVAIPRGTPVKGTVTWKTGRAIGGKSGKFEITFNTLSLRGRDVQLRGTFRQEGKGNTAAALLGSMVISGRSAVMPAGQLVNVFTAEPVTY